MATLQFSVGREPTRYFYPAMAAIFVLAAVVGFTPNSIAILNGTKHNPPLLIHVHAAAMSVWMLLLLVQSALAGTGMMRLHMTLGLSSLVLAPLVALLIAVIALPAFLAPETPGAVVVLQSKRLLFFTGCVGAAIWLRRTAPEAHKRLMLIGTFAVLDAAFFRMGFLPKWGLDHLVSVAHVNMTFLLVPLVIHDIVRFGRIHPVYLVTIPPLLAAHLVASMLW